jgi:alpha-amylase
VALAAHEEWKRANPKKVLGDGRFFMVAEVYNYNIAHGREFDMGGGAKADFFANGFDGLINFGMVHDAKGDYESMFGKYAAQLAGPLKGFSVLNYMSSHDDGNPFDPARTKPFETANKLLLAPGAAQIYYGDETARRLDVAEAMGDAKLRSFMNWGDVKAQAAVRAHWAKLGKFRQAHPAIGAGVHRKLGDAPYTFSRVRGEDKVVVALEVETGRAVDVPVGGVFADGTKVRDAYSGATYVVKDGVVRTGGKHATVLLGR